MRIIHSLNLLFFTLFSANASATNVTSLYEPKVTDASTRGEVMLGFEAGSFAFTGASLTGMGLGLSYRYALNPNVAIQGGLSQAFSINGGFGFLYTGLGFFAHYAVMGSWIAPRQNIEWNGRSIVTVTEKRRNILSLFAGAEQFIFSGKASVYPAPGFAAGLGYQFNISNQPWIVNIRGGTYSLKTGSLSAVILQLQKPLN